MRKIIYILFFLSVSTYAKSGDDKTVSLVTTGQGKTQDEAKQNALRNAIEQAFGAFISSHTEVVNDNLVKDEIISVSNGNIQKYEIISESALPDNLGYTTTLKTIVSISKLTSFCESKGMQIEIKGSLFAFNVIQKELAANNEKKALKELVLMAENIAPKMFDYSIVSLEPYKIQNPYESYDRKYIEFEQTTKKYCLPVKVNIIINKNWEEYLKILTKTLHSLSISKSELEDFVKLNIPYYSFEILTNKKKYNGIYKFYKNPLMSQEIEQQEFDDFIWKKANGPLVKEIVYANSRYHPIKAEDFEKSNYEIKNLFFRSDIRRILTPIYKIIKSSAFDYKIQNQTGKQINSNQFKIMFTTIYNLGGEENHNMSFQQITYNDKDFKKRRDMYAPVSYVNILNENSIIIQNIKPDTIVGFAYCSPLFSLEEIKTLSKLEVKHN
jgi:hypothetical protein